jgi:exodeoxyribonuclease-3
LQETKVQDALFPGQPFAEAGYVHQIIHGQKSYNGVAILSKIPLENAGHRLWCNVDDSRHVFATVNGIDLHNFYVPSGGDVPDPDVNPKFRHKLTMLDELRSWFEDHQDPSKPAICVGDFNIAPLEHDVWSHRQLLDVVSHTPVEVEALKRWQASADFVDTAREFVAEDQKLYSWWSYRARDWQASNRGRRLDHIWITPALREALDDVTILTEARGWEKPSDHVPVTVDLDI